MTSRTSTIENQSKWHVCSSIVFVFSKSDTQRWKFPLVLDHNEKMIYHMHTFVWNEDRLKSRNSCDHLHVMSWMTGSSSIWTVQNVPNEWLHFIIINHRHWRNIDQIIWNYRWWLQTLSTNVTNNIKHKIFQKNSKDKSYLTRFICFKYLSCMCNEDKEL